jgi:sec-independent protein translocase protein TatA
MCPVFAFLDPNPSTLLILGVLAVLLFGERLPEVARSIGKQFMELKKGMGSIQDEIHGAINSVTSAADSTATATPYQPPEDREEATAPKFEPPPSP